MPDWILLAASTAGLGLVAVYVRHTGRLGGTGVILAALAHGALLLLPVSRPPTPSSPVPIDFRAATQPAAEPEPEPEPEPVAAPEPVPDAGKTPERRPRRRKPRTRRPSPPSPPSPEPSSPAPLRFDLTATATTSQSGVIVTTGAPTKSAGPISKPGGSGNGGGRGTEAGRAPAAAAGPSGNANAKDWNPGSSASLASLPVPLKVPEIVCAATASQGVTGTVKLRVQVRASGRVRKVRVVERLGAGCDAVAKRALQRATFKPAKRVGGKATDYEIDYEYVFSTR